MQILNLKNYLMENNYILNFKGINDIDYSKTKKNYSNTSHQYRDSVELDVCFYNSNKKPLKECALHSSNGHTIFHKMNEYEYHDNGNLKIRKIHETSSLPFYNVDLYKISNGQFPTSDSYELTEYNSTGNLIKKLKRNWNIISETLFNCERGIAKKEVKKPCSIDGISYDIVEIFYRKTTDTKPYRILGKDNWGKILLEITDFSKTSKIKIKDIGKIVLK